MGYKMNVCLQPGRTNVLFRPVLGGLSLLATIIVVALLKPWCGDLYHLQAGAQALRQALGTGDELEWWYLGPQTVQDEQALQQSIAHLVRVRSQPYSRRLLGRAYAAQGDLLSSIQVLEQFTSAHPQHPLGHLELAAAYMLAEERWRTMYRIDLLASLSEATLSAPDLVSNVRYVAEGWTSQYVYPTRFVLPPDGQARPTLFLHSGSQVTFTLTLTQPVVLRFSMGLDPRSLDWGGDGATFEVFVNGQRVFLEHLTIEMAREGWQEREVDLRVWSGQRVLLTLATTPGPRADNTADWAGWGDLQVVTETMLCTPEICRQRAVAAWREGGISARQLIEAGEAARKVKRYEEAVRWYERAAKLNPEEGESPLRVGLVYQEIGKWEQAEQMYLIAWSMAPAKAAKYLSLLLEKRGEHKAAEQILREAIFNYPDASDRLEWWRALGNNLQLQGRWNEAFSIYMKAIEEFPNDPALYVGLGWTLYRRGDGLEAALEEMYRALALDSESGDVHITIGMLMGEARHCDEADNWFRLGLERNPYNAWGRLMRANYARACGNLDFALSLYQETLSLFPDFAAAYHEMALAYKLNNQPQEAIDAVEKSLKLMTPPDPWFYVRAGEIYEWAGRIDDAVVAYQHALALDSNNSVALQALERVGK